MRIGFIGLGIMGKPMARNLLGAGHDLVVLDLNQDAVAELAEAGATTAASPRQVAEQVDLLAEEVPALGHSPGRYSRSRCARISASSRHTGRSSPRAKSGAWSAWWGERGSPMALP